MPNVLGTLFTINKEGMVSVLGVCLAICTETLLRSLFSAS